MPREELPPDPDELEKWQRLPQNPPSRRALPPVTGGMRWMWVLVGILVLIAIISLLAQWG